MGDKTDTIEINNILIEGLKQDIYKNMKDKLLSGEDYEIPGVGTIRAYRRKVKSQNESNFAIILKIKQDKDFSKDIRNLYKKNPENFIK